jgi:hypothetical protein
MKLLHSTGATLEVRDCSAEVLMRLRAGAAPIKCNGWVVLEDDEARVLIRRLLDEGAVVVRGEL